MLTEMKLVPHSHFGMPGSIQKHTFHWGVLRHLRDEVGARSVFPIVAIILDLIILAGFIWIKINNDPLVVGVAGAVMLAILILEALFLRSNPIVPQGND